MFYDVFVELCKAKGVTRTKACIDCGVSRTAWHKWENGAIPNGATLAKFAEYFGISVSLLLGAQKDKEPSTESEVFTETQEEAINFIRGLNDEELKRFLKMAKAMFED